MTSRLNVRVVRSTVLACTSQQQNEPFCRPRGRVKARGVQPMTASVATLQISERHRIWRITLDGAFYGDYRSLSLASEGADAAAVTLRAQGRKVTIVALTST